MRQIRITNQYTYRDGEALNRYLKDVSRQNLIEAHEEADLIRKAKNGDETARNKVIQSNLRFVISVAKQYTGSGLPLNDLINEGNIGLVKALEKFDETKGFKFISYAVWWIRQSIIQAIIDKSKMVKVPANRQHSYRKISQKRSEKEQELGRELTQEETANLANEAQVNVSPEDRVYKDHISLEKPLKEEEDTSLNELLCGEEYEKIEQEYAEEDLHMSINCAIDNLKYLEKQILQRFYGLNGFLPRSFDEISHDLQISRERVRQIKYRSIKKLQRCKEKLTVE